MHPSFIKSCITCFHTPLVAVTGGLCLAQTRNISGGVEFHGCTGNASSLDDCPSAEAPKCNKWAGVICTCEFHQRVNKRKIIIKFL